MKWQNLIDVRLLYPLITDTLRHRQWESFGRLLLCKSPVVVLYAVYLSPEKSVYRLLHKFVTEFLGPSKYKKIKIKLAAE